MPWWADSKDKLGLKGTHNPSLARNLASQNVRFETPLKGTCRRKQDFLFHSSKILINLQKYLKYLWL